MCVHWPTALWQWQMPWRLLAPGHLSLSQWRGFVWRVCTLWPWYKHDITYGTLVTETEHKSEFVFTTDTSASRASYGVTIVRNLEKIDRFITSPHCITQSKSFYSHLSNHVRRRLEALQPVGFLLLVGLSSHGDKAIWWYLFTAKQSQTMNPSEKIYLQSGIVMEWCLDL